MAPEDVILEGLSVRHSGRNAPVEKRWMASIGISTPISDVENYQAVPYETYAPTADEAVARLCEDLARVIGYERMQTGWPYGVPTASVPAR